MQLELGIGIGKGCNTPKSKIQNPTVKKMNKNIKTILQHQIFGNFHKYPIEEFFMGNYRSGSGSIFWDIT